MILSSTELFKNISEKSYKKMEKCLRLHKMQYKKGETVCHYGSGSDRIGIVLSGRAAIWRTDYNGTESLLENLPEGAIFSEEMSYASTAGDSIMVRSMVKTEIAYLDYAKILNCNKECKSPCIEFETLRANMTQLLIHRCTTLSERIEVLGCRSIREKLLCFFRLKLNGKEKGKLVLPFTWLELASYIGTDRCAMMREIAAMKKDGTIAVNGYSVHLI